MARNGTQKRGEKRRGLVEVCTTVAGFGVMSWSDSLTGFGISIARTDPDDEWVGCRCRLDLLEVGPNENKGCIGKRTRGCMYSGGQV